MHGNVPVRFGRGRLDSLRNKGLAAYLIATCPGSGGPVEAGARDAAVLAAPGTGVETEESLLVTPFRYDRESEVPRPVPRRSPCSTGGRLHAPHCWGNHGSCAKPGGGAVKTI